MRQRFKKRAKMNWLKWVIILSMTLTSLVSCKSIDKVSFYEILDPPSRPVLSQLGDEPLKDAIQNMNLLMRWGDRWESWYIQYKEYESR